MAVRPFKIKGEIKPGKWLIDYYEPGRKRKKIVWTGSEAEALALEKRLVMEHGRGTIRGNPTINSIIAEYLEWIAPPRRSPKTVQDVLQALKTLRPHFGPLPVNQITRLTFEDYIKTRRQTGRRNSQGKRIGELKPRTINKELAYISAIINWMIKRDYARPLPFKIEKLPSRRPLPQIPSPTTIEKFLAALPGVEKQALARLLYDCGLRWAEASRLRWKDLDLESRLVYVMGKGSRERTGILTERTLDLLTRYKKSLDADPDPSDWVFPSPGPGKYKKGDPKAAEPIKSMRRAFSTASRVVGHKITPHLLRHAYATFTLEATGDLRAVQVELGHSSLDTSTIYTHLSNSRRQEIARRRQEYLNQAEARQATSGKKPPSRVSHIGQKNMGKVIDITDKLRENN